MSAPIGVFDSGIGGLSVLHAMQEHLPSEHFVYFADTAHNPYGDKGDAYVLARSLAIAQDLIETHNIKALVVACNTATAAAAKALRQRWPQLPLVGVEPAVKPAALASRTRRVAVVATRGTVESEKFKALVQRVSENEPTRVELLCMPCDGLADAIEASVKPGTDDTEHATKLGAACAGFTAQIGEFGIENGQIDTLVLGCTHYPLILAQWRAAVGSKVNIIDNGQAIARRLGQLLSEAGALAKGNKAAYAPVYRTSGTEADHAALLRAAAKWAPGGRTSPELVVEFPT